LSFKFKNVMLIIVMKIQIFPCKCKKLNYILKEVVTLNLISLKTKKYFKRDSASTIKANKDERRVILKKKNCVILKELLFFK
jgi:hypothetical protein